MDIGSLVLPVARSNVSLALFVIGTRYTYLLTVKPNFALDNNDHLHPSLDRYRDIRRTLNHEISVK